MKRGDTKQRRHKAALPAAHRFAFRAMGSPCEMTLCTPTRRAATKVAARVQHDVARLEARYSRYREDSLLADINRVAAKGGHIAVDEETSRLVDYAATCFEESSGLFDVSSGILREAWHLESGALPDPALIAQLRQRIGFDRIVWRAPYLSFPEPGMALDFGGIVKEYAADRACALCLEMGVVHGFVNLGGDIRVLGPRPAGAAWHIGIKHPRATDSTLATLELTRGAIATSGDYERCLVIEGVRYGHVLNPHTGWPVRHLASVSVVADLCVIAGSAATIAMLKEDAGPAWLATLGLAHLWVTVDGAVGGSLASACM